MNLTKNGKVFTSKSVGTGPSSCGKRIYWAAVSQKLRNTGLITTMTELSWVIYSSCRILGFRSGTVKDSVRPEQMDTGVSSRFILLSTMRSSQTSSLAFWSTALPSLRTVIKKLYDVLCREATRHTCTTLHFTAHTVTTSMRTALCLLSPVQVSAAVVGRTLSGRCPTAHAQGIIHDD